MAEAHPLKRYRENHNPPLTQERLARRLRVTKVTVSRWEARKRQPEGKVLKRVSRVTGIPIAELRPDLAAMFAPPLQPADPERAREAAE